MTNRAPTSASLVTHPAFLRPGFGRHHPLSTGRQQAVFALIDALGWAHPGAIVEAPLASRDLLLRFHRADYLAALERCDRERLATPDDRTRFGLGTMENPIFPGLLERVSASVGGAAVAARLAFDRGIAFHPGGGTHHGRPDRAAGFSYSNDPVFAILALLDAGLDRITYVDLDAHHGDGVEAAFEHDPRVSLLSFHEAGRWPGTGPTGTRAGGRVVNVMTPRGIGDDGYTRIVDDVLQPFLARLRPQAIVVTLGADALAGDPLSDMQLSNRRLWQTVDLCLAHAGHGIILGGGGYNPWTTARLWAGQWGRLIAGDWPQPLPPAASNILAALDSDLVDPDDRRPHWFTALDDPANPGRVPVEAVRALVAAAHQRLD